MAIKKSELYGSIWASCDELRGGMDASQYKDYVLVLLFVKYVSDKYAGQKNPLIVIPKGGGFKDMVALKGDKDIGNKMNVIIAALAKANELTGVIDLTDFNDPDKLGRGKEMQERLSNLVAIFENPSLDFSKNRAEGDDLLGDAYEYLMRHFATDSGKSKGQFYTPAEVSRIMAKVIGISAATSPTTTIYDPTCGSGSLLLKAADEAKVAITIYGQEMDNSTAGLARMNMILHDNPTAEIWKDNTLSSPHYKEKNGQLRQFDFAVANPPFSTKAWSNGFDPEHDLYGRFEFGIPPKKNGDYAFLLHLLRSLKSTGKGAVVMPHGVLFRGGAEGEIRKNILQRGYIKGIIGLPPNLFYGTGIPACLVILDKENAAGRKGLFMINASQGFNKDGNKNRLRHQDIHKIVDAFNRQLEIPKFSRLVPTSEISGPKNDYNLNIPRYIDNSQEEDMQDIAAHLLGGIPNRDLDNIGRYWEVLPSLRKELFGPADRAGYSKIQVGAAQIKSTILAHAEFVAYKQKITALFDKWKQTNRPRLAALKVGSHPNALIDSLGDDLMAIFAEAQLLDKYDVYQRLMTYWADTMQDDVYMITTEGWDANTDLIPQQLVIGHYFSAQQKGLEKLTAEQAAINAQMVEMTEEHGGEGGLLYEVTNDKGKIAKVNVKARLKEIESDEEATDERKMIQEYLALIEKESEAGKKVKEAQKDLDAIVAARYQALAEAEVKTLVVDDKWLSTLAADIQSELSRVSEALTGRIKELAQRYAMPLPAQIQKVGELSAKVNVDLKKMGLQWR